MEYGWSTSLTSALNVYPDYVHASNGIDVWQDNGHISWGAPNVAHNSTGSVVDSNPQVVTWQPYQFSFHPGQGSEFSHAVWTSTVAGDLDLAGAFTGIDHTGTTSDVHILLNATPVFDGIVNGYGNTSSFSTTVTVGIGDRIDFAVGYGANHTFWDDSTALSATIVRRRPRRLQPERCRRRRRLRRVAEELGHQQRPAERSHRWHDWPGAIQPMGARISANPPAAARRSADTSASDAIPEPATFVLIFVAATGAVLVLHTTRLTVRPPTFWRALP